MVDDAAIDESASGDRHRAGTPGQRGGCRDHVERRTLGQQHLAALKHVERDSVQRNLSFGEILELDVSAHLAAESPIGDEMVTLTGETTDERAHTDGEQVVTAQPEPDARELVDDCPASAGVRRRTRR